MLRATTACTFSTSQLPKVVRTCGVLYILTWKCASRHNGVHFFDIATSKSGPTMWCFVHFDLDMCFAPQRRALFRHRNFQKWSDIGVLCTFWLGNVLRATTACTFSTSQRTKVVRTWCVLYIFTWKCASRHNGVHFLISHLASCLRTRRFSEPAFPPSGATNHWKNTGNRDFQCFTTFLPFRASASSFFWLFLFSDLLSSNLSLLSASSLLCFSSVHIVGSLASKLPSIIFFYKPSISSIYRWGLVGQPPSNQFWCRLVDDVRDDVTTTVVKIYVGDVNSFHELYELRPWQKGCISYSFTKEKHRWTRTRSAIYINLYHLCWFDQGENDMLFLFAFALDDGTFAGNLHSGGTKTHRFNRTVSRAILVDEDFNSVVHSRLRTFELEVG